MNQQAKKAEREAANAAKAVAAIVAVAGPWRRGCPAAAGRILCPVCRQPEALVYHRTGTSGILTARCQTTGCETFIE